MRLTNGIEARMSSALPPHTLLANSKMLSSSSAEGISSAMLLCLTASRSLNSLCPSCTSKINKVERADMLISQKLCLVSCGSYTGCVWAE